MFMKKEKERPFAFRDRQAYYNPPRKFRHCLSRIEAGLLCAIPLTILVAICLLAYQMRKITQ